MRISFNFGKAIGSLLGMGGDGGSQVYFKGSSAADDAARQRQAADEAQRKSLADAQARSGAASSLLTSPDAGGEFSKIGGKKTLLGGA